MSSTVTLCMSEMIGSQEPSVIFRTYVHRKYLLLPPDEGVCHRSRVAVLTVRRVDCRSHNIIFTSSEDVVATLFLWLTLTDTPVTALECSDEDDSTDPAALSCPLLVLLWNSALADATRCAAAAARPHAGERE